jgi:hypothetical protein
VHPGKGDKYSCFSLKSLRRIANKYNKTHNDNINLELDRINLLNELKKRFSRECGNSQSCWKNISIVKNLNDSEINYNTFRPEGPDEKYGWLSTDRILMMLYINMKMLTIIIKIIKKNLNI